MNRITLLFVLTCVLFVGGCAVPSAYIVKPRDDGGIEITARMTKFLFIFDSEPKLGPGVYKAELGDKKLSVDTKMDLKVFDFNMLKAQE